MFHFNDVFFANIELFSEKLGPGEQALGFEAFFLADVDDESGFLAITSRRFIFVADRGKGSTIVHEHPLSTAGEVELVRRGLRHKLRVSWPGAESLVGGLDREQIARLQHHLQDRGLR